MSDLANESDPVKDVIESYRRLGEALGPFGGWWENSDAAQWAWHDMDRAVERLRDARKESADERGT